MQVDTVDKMPFKAMSELSTGHLCVSDKEQPRSI